jgi:glycosyltransferase involved in cell wall biosynthesis
MIKGNKIAVLIPVYNDADGLINSIHSIKEDILLDLVIVDDGSTVKLDKDILQSNFNNGKIYLITLSKNSGIEKALNDGLEFIKQKGYEYIARLDSGDLCLPKRFEKQINRFKNDKELYLLGSQVSYIDVNGNFLYNSSFPTQYDQLKKYTYFNCFIVHSAVMFKQQVLKDIGFYSYDFPAAEDYDYFFKIIKKYKAENHPEILLKVLIDPQGISNLKRKRQIKSKLRIIWKHRYFGVYPIFGLVRNGLLYLFPRNIVVAVRKLLS